MRDFDCWTLAQSSVGWLHKEKATLLHTEWGFNFWENPIYGDEASILATHVGSDESGWVYNTQDYDLPTSDPMVDW